MRIVCVGGGPAGLYFAILMKERDPTHEVTVLERNPRGVTYGWGVVFWEDLLEELWATDGPTARQIGANAFRWNGELLAVEGKEPVFERGPGFAIGRHRLLDILLQRALALGVEVEFERDIADTTRLPEADLVVACDGAGSRTREEHRDAFQPDVSVGRNKYVWLGTSKVFRAFTFAFVPTPAGWIWSHAYGFDDDTSTFIVECSPETWSGLGFDALDEESTIALLEELFASCLDGHRLQSGAGGHAQWLNFRTVTNERWHDDETVLMGDAAHTTHFTIGSGTKLALEDAIALAARLHDRAELPSALEAYEEERRLSLRPAQTDARFSAWWFESIERYADLDPPRLFGLLHERRSPLLPHIPPRLYYRLHEATHESAALRRLRRWAAPRIKALYH